jgi:hypothetical protein
MVTLSLAALLLVVAGYAQWQIPAFTRSERGAMATRMLLMLLGIAVGVALARSAQQRPDMATYALFFAGFGLVHVPAALILFLKRQRHEGKS